MAKHIGAAALSATFLALASGANAASAISSSVYTSGYLNVNVPNTGGVSSSDTQSQLGTVNSLSAQVILEHTVGNDYGTASSVVGASWVDSNSGSAWFSRVGWGIHSSSESAVKLNGGNDLSNLWAYTFVADGNGTFDMNYDVSGIGDKFGLWGASIGWTGPGGGLNISNAFDPTANGLFSRSIVAGEQYTVSIFNNANLYGEFGLNSDGHTYGKFDWSISESAVPSPAAALPFLGGFVMALKRRRK